MLAECLLAVLALSLLSSLCLSAFDLSVSRYWSFGDAYLKEKSAAIVSGESTDVEIEGQDIHFTGRGNIHSARTITFDGKKIIIELGGGRLVYP